MMQAWADYLDTLREAARVAERARLSELERPAGRRRRRSSVDAGSLRQPSPLTRK
jgi:hypothetical protein